MKKIPTLFLRDPDDMRRVLPEVHPDCKWVLDGEGVATRKYDGTCVMLDVDGQWWARREVKPGKTPPAEFVAIDHDETTGKTVGWEPIDYSGFSRWFWIAAEGGNYRPGTYELIGPKINGNPEHVAEHGLIAHGMFAIDPEPPRDYDGLRALLTGPDWPLHREGIVWHHPDGRMAKLKARDFKFG